MNLVNILRMLFQLYFKNNLSMPIEIIPIFRYGAMCYSRAPSGLLDITCDEGEIIVFERDTFNWDCKPQVYPNTCPGKIEFGCEGERSLTADMCECEGQLIINDDCR